MGGGKGWLCQATVGQGTTLCPPSGTSGALWDGESSSCVLVRGPRFCVRLKGPETAPPPPQAWRALAELCPSSEPRQPRSQGRPCGWDQQHPAHPRCCPGQWHSWARGCLGRVALGAAGDASSLLQQLNSFGNYQFLFQDLAINTLIGLTSKSGVLLGVCVCGGGGAGSSHKQGGTRGSSGVSSRAGNSSHDPKAPASLQWAPSHQTPSPCRSQVMPRASLRLRPVGK